MTPHQCLAPLDIDCLGGLNYDYGEGDGVPNSPIGSAGGELHFPAGKGDHEVWSCPCGHHRTTVTRPGTVSPGLVRQAIIRLTYLPKGWL